MLENYAFIGIFMLIALIFPFIGLAVAALLSPKRPDPIKTSTYECGIETIGDTWVQFKAQYYLYALIFVIFDIELVFLFPWAVAYTNIDGWSAVAAFIFGTIFIVTLAEGLVYAWRKGALEWQ